MTKQQFNKELMDKLIGALNDLYIIRRDKYLLQKDGGSFTMTQGKISATTGRKTPPLVDSLLKQHLRGKATYGVFSKYKTKFMLFDFDFKNDFSSCKWHYYKVYQALIEMGFPDDCIYTTLSGMKGIHLTIFFDRPLPVTDAQALYESALSMADLSHMKDKIEFRPLPKQAIKMPLGVHTKTGKRVSFVENLNVDNVLPPTTILSANKILVDDVIDILAEIDDDAATPFLSDKQVVDTFNAEILPKVEPLDIYKLGADSDFTIDYHNDLLQNGIKAKGTRHKATYQLALFLKSHYGYNELQAKGMAIQWLDEQTGRYDTPYDEAVADTVKIVEHIYDNDLTLSIPQKELTLSIDELRAIVTARDKNGKHFTPKQKAVLFALLIHSKRYENAQHAFYMTYDQIIAMTEYKNRNMIAKLMTDLEESGYIAIHRRNEQQPGTFMKRPNMYEVLFSAKEKAVDNVGSIENDLIRLEANQITSHTFTELISDNFEAKDLRALLPRRQAQHFISNIS